jgi:C1A family cysteine protease
MTLLRQLLTLSLCLCGGLLAVSAAAAAEDKDPHATGLRPPTAAEREWERKHLIVTRNVRLNQLGLDRVNAERAQKGQRGLTAAEVGLAPLGQETEGATAEQMAAAGATAAPAGEAPAALPAYVDNSTLKYFPPVRSQGGIGSCAQWTAMYYCYTHMNAMARDLDAKAGGAGNNSYIFSPKFTYNLVNGGSDSGSWMSSGWSIAQNHGCATWADWPYDGDYRGWPLTASVYRTAINYRAQSQGSISSVDTNSGLTQIKTYLSNGYVLSYATNIYAWSFTTIGNDPGTSADDAFVGKSACSWLGSGGGGHGMTVVGYNDDIWIDINGNGSVDSGEKGALRIVNSWGTGWYEGGFTWLAYDALKATSAVSGGPSSGRQAAFWSNQVLWVTARASYTPKVVAEFTLNHANRSQLYMTLGINDTTKTTPSTSWSPSSLLAYSGGAYAFDGSGTACDGTFVFDFTDILPTAGQNKRWFLGMYDSAAGSTATLTAYKLTNVSTGEVATCADVPKTADGAQVYAWIDWTYNAGSNTAPTISNIADQSTNEDTAKGPLSFTIGDAQTPADSLTLTKTSSNLTVAPLANIVFGGSGANRTVTVTPGANQSGTATITVTVTDAGGLSASDSFVLTVNAVNDAPVAGAKSLAVYPNTAKAFTLPASDAEGDALTYTVLTNPLHGTLSGTAPNLTYTPTTGYKGADSFTWKAYDGSLYSNVATVSITVDAVTVWVEDAMPVGASPSGTWSWVGAAPAPYSGAKAHQEAAASGSHQHYFTGATETLALEAGDIIFTYVYLDAASTPTEVMLQFNDGDWEHRAYWGANSIGWGTDGTESRRYMGALPATGQWVRLEVPASQVGLEGRTLNGMAFTLCDGAATWDYTGKCKVNHAPAISSFSPANPVTVPAGTTQPFSVDASDSDADTLSYLWKLDGVTVPVTINTMNYSPLAADAGAHTIVCTVSDGRGGSVSQTWNVTVTAPGNRTLRDFTGDGKADILWRETATGKTVVWTMDGATKTASAYTSASASTAWVVAGVADFTGDGKADILWRETATGKTVVWTMNGATKTASAYTSASAGTGWVVAGVADFTGDGKADILWRETATGKTVVWTMNGATKTASAYTSASAGTTWLVSGVADFTGDGKADILWRETGTGKTVVWTMDGATKTASAYTSASAGTAWAVVQLSDFTGDGKADILWRETATGKTVVWTMNGATKTASAYTSASAGTGWVVQ